MTGKVANCRFSAQITIIRPLIIYIRWKMISVEQRSQTDFRKFLSKYLELSLFLLIFADRM